MPRAISRSPMMTKSTPCSVKGVGPVSVASLESASNAQTACDKPSHCDKLSRAFAGIHPLHAALCTGLLSADLRRDEPYALCFMDEQL